MASFRQYLESHIQVAFRQDHLDHHHGQDDYVIYAYIPDTKVVIGKLLFSVFEGVPHINWIEVADEYKRQGIGTQLMKQLQKEFTYGKIRWGMTTPDGSELKKGIERRMGN